MTFRHTALLMISCSLITSCAAVAVPNPTVPTPRAGPVQEWLTTPDQSKLLSAESALSFAQDGGEMYPTITVDEGRTYQQMEGVGAAFTDSSTWLLQKKLSAAQRKAALEMLFDAEKGIGLDYTRIPMGGTDLALSHYSYDDLPAGETDPELKKFSIAHDEEYIIPVIKEAQAINKNLKFMASPWSPPGWMKTTGSMIKGSLRPEFYGAFSNYFVKFIQAYGQHGIAIDAITLQNEPQLEPDNYPGMRISAQEKVQIIRDHLGPLFEQQKINSKILAWDFNWDNYDYANQVLSDPGARKYIAGTAWHCYGGDKSAMTQTHDSHPDKGIYFTECSGGTWRPGFAENIKWVASNLIIGAPRNWAKTVVMWGLALDPNGNPHAGGCGTCAGLISIDQTTGEVKPYVDYYVFGHYGKAVRPGAVRIDSATYNLPVPSELESVAFKNPDGSKVLIVLNASSDAQLFKVKEHNSSFYATLPAGSLATFKWSGSGSDNPVPTPPTAPPRNAYKRIEAENYSSMKGVQKEGCTDEGLGQDIGWIDSGDHLVFDQVDFQDGSAKTVSVRVASANQGGTIEFREGSLDGPVIATAEVPGTGGWQNWQTVTVPAKVSKGVQKLYVVFPQSTAFNVNWFQFGK
ncbi:carbohydrate-binding protein [Deinococcus roseus]|uniref:CBM6 domain-containing protein n=1 Tax=Deinococcus roseus TaxID=392414 RepID=A0ABQ2DKR7_9DEIO|nr:carbohydrate-binding protein [Deinococcus roseus]GGJ57006.1 hypothetical protein GCM10008938_48950 [Deinococcus roseus]